MSEQEREAEEDEGEGTSDTAPMLPRRPPALRGPGGPSLAIRGLRTLLLPGRTLAALLLHLLLPGTVFLLALLPAAAVVYLGFLCHSKVRPAPGARCRALLSDRGSAALIVLGFLALPPLLALASAARTRLALRLRALLPPPAPGSRADDGRQQLCARL